MLTIRECESTVFSGKPHKLSDEKGLYLLVSGSGKYWRLDYRFGDKRKTLSIGVFPETTLRDARAERDAARKLLKASIDPADHMSKQAKKSSLTTETERTFEAVARRWHSKTRENLIATYAEKVLSSLERDVFPVIGAKAIGDINPTEVLAMLRKIEARGALETLKRVRQRCADIFTFAIAEGLRQSENPVTGLEKALKPARSARMPSLHANRLPEFFIRLDAVRIGAPVKHAIELAVLLFVRPSELRCARWDEIDLEAGEWVIPAERDRSRGLLGMKMREAHTVPLSRQAVEVFGMLKAHSGAGELVFPNRNDPTRAMSDGTVNSALRAMGYSAGEVTGHGFRATAASALAEAGWRKEVIDRQLSHRERNQVLAAYVHQAEYLAERRKMMQEWADTIDRAKRGEQPAPLRRVA